MTMKCRLLPAVVVMGLLSLDGGIAHSQTAPVGQAGLDGIWTGTYRCGTFSAAMELELTPGPLQGTLEGLFTFSDGQVRGRYTVSGRVDTDNRFTLVPRAWIERPGNMVAITLEGGLAANGASVSGRPTPCGGGEFSAQRQDGTAAPGALASAPPSGGPLAGRWEGAIECRQNRRGRVEDYPLTLDLWQDGDGVAGIARLRIWKKRMDVGGAAFDQTVSVAGRVVDGALALDRAIVLDKGGAGFELRGLTVTPDAPGGLAGEVSMRGCETVAVARTGEARSPDITGFQGQWFGAGGQREDTGVELVIAAQPEAYAVLRATAPLSRELALRDRLELLLQPIAIENGALLLAPLNSRDATGPFAATDGPVRHQLRTADLHVVHPRGDGAVSLGVVLRQAMLSDMLASRPRDAARLYTLSPQTDSGANLIAEGELPPVDLGPLVTGTVARAPSREAQCRVLQDWIAPVSAGRDVSNRPLDTVLREFAPVFQDGVFVPVFGAPYVLLSRDERQAITQLIRRTCQPIAPDRALGIVADYTLSDVRFRQYSALLADEAEVAEWSAGLLATLAALDATPDSLNELGTLRAGLNARARTVSQAKRSELRAAIDRRGHEIQADMMVADLNRLADVLFDDGTFDAIFRVLNRLTSLETPVDLARPVRDRAFQLASGIMDERYAELAGISRDAPADLSGLAEVMAGWNRLRGARDQMQAQFRTLGPEDALRPVFARLDEYWQHEGILAQFRLALDAIETGPLARPVILNAAARYVDLDWVQRAPGWGEAIEAAIDTAEIRSLRIVDRSTGGEPHEPTAHDIARFVLQRVRSVNAHLLALEDRCLSGQFTNALQAMECLQHPGIVTNRRGFAAMLHSVTKIGCTTEVIDRDYLCIFTQEIGFNLPGGEAFGMNILVQQAPLLTAAEAVDARFIRAADGGWSILWGDL
jgi:hypothetical protein